MCGSILKLNGSKMPIKKKGLLALLIKNNEMKADLNVDTE
jgi:hypothetical protein